MQLQTTERNDTVTSLTVGAAVAFINRLVGVPVATMGADVTGLIVVGASVVTVIVVGEFVALGVVGASVVTVIVVGEFVACIQIHYDKRK